jgi:type III secretory pathway component EscR
MGVGCPVKRSARTAGTRQMTNMSTLLTLFLLAPMGLHQFVAESLGMNYDEMKETWNVAQQTRRTRKEFLDKMRAAYSEFFKGSEEYNTVMEVIDTALDLQR